MASIDSKDIVLVLLRNNGIYPGDPQLAAVSRYKTPEGKEVYHLAIRNALEIWEAMRSPYVMDLQILWTAKDGLSPEGLLMLQGVSEDEYLSRGNWNESFQR